MDVAIDWPTLAPVPVFGILFYLVIHFLRQQSVDRGDYQATVMKIRQRHDAETDRLRAENQRLQNELDETRERLHEARAARWKAEDQAAHYRRLAGEVPDESPNTSP